MECPERTRASRGFTLIEMIFYIALIVIMLGALLSFSISMIDSGAKDQTVQTVNSEAQYASERLIQAIRNASGINTSTSNFGVNFAASSGAVFSLAESASSANPTIFSVASGTLLLQQGTSSPIALNSSSTQIASLIFSNYSTGTFSNIGFTLNMIATGGGSSPTVGEEFRASTTIEASAELRSE